MKRSMKILVVALLLSPIVAPLIALAAQEVMMIGVDSDGAERRILVDTSGRPITLTAGAAAHGACVNTTQTLTGTASNVPATSDVLSTRRSLFLCNSESGETISCEFDGNAATVANGLEIQFQDCLVVSLSGDVNASCLSDGTSSDLKVMQCP